MQTEQTLQLIRGRGTKGWRVLAYFLWATAFVFMPITAVSIKVEEWPIVMFLVPVIIVFVAVGCACWGLGKKQMSVHEKSI